MLISILLLKAITLQKLPQIGSMKKHVRIQKPLLQANMFEMKLTTYLS